MPANTFGEIFRLTTFGESHGKAIGGIIDGCPPGLLLDLEMIQSELNRRRPGQSNISSPRNEPDEVVFLSGLFEGKTTGTPLAFMINSKDQQSKDYSHLETAFRPSHADYTYQVKYGLRDYRGGGRSSARETASRVVAGAIARQFLASQQVSFTAFVTQIGIEKLQDYPEIVSSLEIEKSLVRCPVPEASERMQQLIEEMKEKGDTLGGVITCYIDGLPVGLGAPVFDKFHADLAKAMLSINAVKAFEYGSGFAGVEMPGSQHNDSFTSRDGKLRTLTNNSGGVQGGITNGERLYFRTAFKPVATIMQKQQTVDKFGKDILLEAKGRHDVCVVPRAVPIVEAMAALVTIDHFLRHKIYQHTQ
ncbi:MAG: chorismate synthase [Bacteroidetes bacterium]|nr:chorismate synthase [Bacteroidota bacterium]MBU1580670.1 chorismate synthase [Bacteroidota bacterium]MBU2558023.1 chorismate synthase [Bacteroidota bacterium]